MTQAHQGTALITGASSGIGAVYADRLARRGYDLILVARNRDRLAALADRITNDTQRSVEIVDADLNDRTALAAVEAKLKQDASITLLVNNAGVGTHTPLLDSDVDAMTRMIDLNVTALTRLTYAAVPGFVARGKGALINIASIVAIRPEQLNGVYAARRLCLPSASRCTMNSQTRACRCKLYYPAPPPPISGRSAAFRWNTCPRKSSCRQLTWSTPPWSDLTSANW